MPTSYSSISNQTAPRVNITSKIAPDQWIIGVEGYTDSKSAELRAFNFLVAKKYNYSDKLNDTEIMFRTFIQEFNRDKELLQSFAIPDRMTLYANAAQALLGDNTVKKPSIINFIKWLKWGKYSSLKGTPSYQCKENFVNLAKTIFMT